MRLSPAALGTAFPCSWVCPGALPAKHAARFPVLVSDLERFKEGARELLSAAAESTDLQAVGKLLAGGSLAAAITGPGDGPLLARLPAPKEPPLPLRAAARYSPERLAHPAHPLVSSGSAPASSLRMLQARQRLSPTESPRVGPATEEKRVQKPKIADAAPEDTGAVPRCVR